MTKRPLGVYIHIPFCVRKCRYCDFLSFSEKEEQMVSYVESLTEEIRCFFQREPDYKVCSIYLGGGTPSILEPKLTEKLLQTVFMAADVAADAEITTEANPGTLTREKLKAYKKAGINRLSLGLQSTVKQELEYLGRIHCYEDFLESYHMARQEGFSNLNVDLMSAIPLQTLESWEQTLLRILELEPEHISAYSLIVEEGTPFYEDERLEKLIPDEDTERAMYELTEKLLEKRGYQRYEISNYAKPGRECRHNLIYWDRQDYIGFGLGAASCIRDTRFSNTDHMESYLKQPFTDFYDRENLEKLSLQEQMEEAMILGLRKTEGISKKVFSDRYGEQMDHIFGDVISKYQKEGLLEQKDDFIRFTKRGFDLSNIVLCEFLS